MDFPGGSDGKESACNPGDQGLIPFFGKIPWRMEWLPTLAFLSREFHGGAWQASESDTTEQLTPSLSYIGKII